MEIGIRDENPPAERRVCLERMIQRDLQSPTPGRGVGSADDNLSPGRSV